MSGLFGGLGSLFSQAGRFREEAERLQQELGTKTVEGSAGGGLVRVVVNGRQEVVSLHLEAEVLGDKAMAEDLVRAATNQALAASRQMAQDAMKNLFGGMVPGLGALGDLFGGGAKG